MTTPLELDRGVQIAGVHDEAELALLAAAGATCVGLPLRLGYHTPDLSEDAAITLSRRSPLPVVLITYDPDPASVAALATAMNVAAVQMHADSTDVAALRAALPSGCMLFQSVVISPGETPETVQARARAVLPFVDALLTDTHDPVTGATGATGKTHDWALSRALVGLGKPVILAGGLHAGNVAAAIRATGVRAVDAHTGVEGPDGRKDAAKVRAFVNAARTAWEAG